MRGKNGLVAAWFATGLAAQSSPPPQTKMVADAWRTACKRAGGVHKTFATKLDAEGHRSRAVQHCERALSKASGLPQ